MTSPVEPDRRDQNRRDRRRHPRGGRRSAERRAKWQRVAWLVAAYGIYLGLRTIPSAFRRLWQRR